MCSHSNRLVEAILTSTHNIPFSIQKKNSPLIILHMQLWDFPRISRTSSKQPWVNEPSVFEPLKFYCIWIVNVHIVCLSGHCMSFRNFLHLRILRAGPDIFKILKLSSSIHDSFSRIFILSKTNNLHNLSLQSVALKVLMSLNSHFIGQHRSWKFIILILHMVLISCRFQIW